MQHPEACKNQTDYYTLDDIAEIPANDRVYVKLGENVFCMESNSYKDMIRFSAEQKVRGDCTHNMRSGNSVRCRWFYPVLAAPLVFITEESYRSRRKEVIRGTNGRYYELVNRKRIDFTTGLHIIGEKTGFDDVYDLVPSRFTVDDNGKFVPGSPIMPRSAGRSAGRAQSQPSLPLPSPSGFQQLFQQQQELIQQRLRLLAPLPEPSDTPPARRPARRSVRRSPSPARRSVRRSPSPAGSLRSFPSPYTISPNRMPAPRRVSPPRAPSQQRNYTVTQLKQICKDKGIRGYSKMKKSDLIRHCQVNDATSSTMSVKDLRQLCKDKGIRGYSKMKKSELLRRCA